MYVFQCMCIFQEVFFNFSSPFLMEKTLSEDCTFHCTRPELFLLFIQLTIEVSASPERGSPLSFGSALVLVSAGLGPWCGSAGWALCRGIQLAGSGCETRFPRTCA